MSLDLLIICTHQNIIELGSLYTPTPAITITLDTNGTAYIDQLKHAIYDYLKKMEMSKINYTHSHNVLNLGVLYTEGILFSMRERKEIYRLIISYFKFRFIEFMPNPFLYCFGNNVANAIIVDIEYDMIIGTPIYEYTLLDEYICVSTRSIQNVADEDQKSICTLLFGDDINNNNNNNSNSKSTHHNYNYEPNDQSICMMIDKFQRVLPIDIRKTLTQNVILNGYYKKLLLDYSQHMRTFFKINSKLDKSLWSCSMVYGAHLMKNKYSLNSSRPLNNNNINSNNNNSTNRNLETLDWYQRNYIF